MSVPNSVFRKELRRSKKSVRAVAEMLKRRGRKVRIHPDFGRPDECDIYIRHYGKVKHVEVKHPRGLTFTSLDDINFRYVIIDKARRIDHRLQTDIKKLYAYYICNSDMTMALVIRPSSRSHWVKKKIYIEREKEEFWMYVIPREHVSGIVRLRDGKKRVYKKVRS